METSRIVELLQPYVAGMELPHNIFEQLNRYLGLLLRWNGRTNLTAIREPEQIVTRHFGESLFAAKVLFSEVTETAWHPSVHPATLADLGSGAGFPGVPIKLAVPILRVTLIESQNKKATFLKEVIRTLELTGVDLYGGRAEQWGRKVDVVTLRAVERFQLTLPTAAHLLNPGGWLCLLTSSVQAESIQRVLPMLSWKMGKTMPNSTNIEVLVGHSTLSRGRDLDTVGA